MRALLVALAVILAACNTAAAPDSAAGGKDTMGCTSTTMMPAPNPPESPAWQIDPLGPLSDVTCSWQHYQPAAAFCVKLDGVEYAPGGAGVLTDGSDPACAFSGFAPGDTGLYRFAFDVPPLCAGCRRMFIDFTQIPADDPANQLFYAHGHAYYRISSLNPGYTVDPIAHSPNTKNFFNDKLVSPPGTPVETLVGAMDTHDMAYVTDVAHFIHTAIQGAHYIGPWYVNREGQRIHGVYLDVNVADATALGDPNLDDFFYEAGYYSGQPACPDSLSPMTADADSLYGGCVDRPGGSSAAFDPFQ